MPSPSVIDPALLANSDATAPTATLGTTKEKVQTYMLFLSDQAFEGLREQAKEAQFIRGDTNAYGLGQYLTALAPHTLYDTRPYQLRNVDATMLSTNRLPVWAGELPRRRRSISFPPSTLTILATHARNLGIVNPRVPTSLLRPNSLASVVLEAIGIGWLTADVHPLFVRRRPAPVYDANGTIRH